MTDYNGTVFCVLYIPDTPGPIWLIFICIKA